MLHSQQYTPHDDNMPGLQAKLRERAMQKDKQRRAKLAAAGIVYDWPALGHAASPVSKSSAAASLPAVKELPSSVQGQQAQADSSALQEQASKPAKRTAKAARAAGCLHVDKPHASADASPFGKAVVQSPQKVAVRPEKATRAASAPLAAVALAQQPAKQTGKRKAAAEPSHQGAGRPAKGIGLVQGAKHVSPRQAVGKIRAADQGKVAQTGVPRAAGGKKRAKKTVS